MRLKEREKVSQNTSEERIWKICPEFAASIFNQQLIVKEAFVRLVEGWRLKLGTNI